MGLENLLSRLDGLRQTGADRWVAKCPAHPDRSPSLSVRDAGAGRILMHCFAGCSAVDVVESLGLTIGDLFPERSREHFHRGNRNQFSALDALKCLTAESSVVAIAASDIALGRPLSDADAERVATAAGRIATALEVCHGR